LNNGGYALQMVGLPSSIVTMLQGAILLFVLGGDTLMRYRIRFLGWRGDSR
jgi:simple sugar transport system permease protein